MFYNSNHPLVDILKTVDINSCPRIFNFHLHTTFSDGSLSPEQLINQAIQHGIRHIAVTDHHTQDSYPVIRDWLRNNQIDKSVIQIWTGLEITSLLNGCLVHILALGCDYKSEHLQRYNLKESANGEDLEAENVVESIHKANGLAILAHPARYRKPYKELIEASFRLKFDGIEVWYDYERSQRWTPTRFVCKEIDNYTKSLKMLTTCGTDTHGISILRR